MNIDNWENEPQLNITPLVDIMLVLLAILMVTAPVLIYEENIELPQGSRTEAIQQIPAVEITISKNKEVLYNKQAFSVDEFINSFIVLSSKLPKDSKVYINADRRIDYGAVMKVLSSIKEAGFSQVSLMTDG